MSKISLEMSVDSVYSVIDERVLGIKSSIINLCSDIDRYFRLKFHLNISNDVYDHKYNLVKKEYPYLSKMPLEMFNRFLSVFKNIRDINAHLHLNKPIFIDDDIIEYLTYILKPDYLIVIDNKLTVYGQAYILYFLSRKYNIFPFVTSFFKFQYFKEIQKMDGKEKSDYQVRTQHTVQEICGVGKPIFPDNVVKLEYQFMNDLFKGHMTRFIYGIEKLCSRTDKSFDESWSIGKVLRNAVFLEHNEEVFNLIVDLRNCWLHGVCLNEPAEIDGNIVELNYQFIFKAFAKIKRWLLKNQNECKDVISELNKFVISCFNYYALRLVEVSYKVLDSRLLTEEKIDERVKNLKLAFDRFNNAQKDYYELAGELIEPDDLIFEVAGCKFSDSVRRITKCLRLRILCFTSESGFDIGDFHTDSKELFIASVDLNPEFMNEINGRYIPEYRLTKEIKYGNRISVYSANV